MRLTLVTLVLFLVSSCSSGTDPVFHDTSNPGPDSADQSATPDVMRADLALPDALDDMDFGSPEEVTPDEVFVPCNPGEGCFLDPCDQNSDCQSGWCVEHMGEAVCSELCQEECPPGWSCKPVGSSGPDLTTVCVSNFANLCRPCTTGADCKSVGDNEDVCVDYGAEGNFCGGTCATDTDCPWGFLCSEAVTVNGISTWQCIAEAGVCPCTGKSISLALTTPCEVTNESGTCVGQRVCTEDGLSDCDAPVPAVETCNGTDDDCDGFVDEPDEVGGNFVNLCDDGNPCTADTCDETDGCLYQPLDQGECLDGDACTIGDHCEAGECIGAPIACDDDNPCTDDVCDGLGGCDFLPNNADCDDGDPCTVADTCKDSECVGFAIECACLVDADCTPYDDGNPCTGTLFCNTDVLPYQCQVVPDSEVVCPPLEGPGSFCLQATCNPATGQCETEPDHEGFACNDDDACTIGESCQQGQCAGGVPANCNDGNPCTDDSCDPDTGCLHQDNTTSCEDGNACTVGDACLAGTCQPGATVSCDDGNPCTADSCTPASGCQHQALEGACDDGNPCTLGDTCIAGACKGTMSLDCDDDNPCTTDQCSPTEGCIHGLNTAPCDDGNPCTTGDHCQLGECLGGQETLCQDNNPCTDDACNPQVGCTFTPNSQPCDDGNACTTDDTCTNGWCSGAYVPCDDNNPCTDDSCDPAEGCLHLPNSAACTDGDACTINDQCVAGECVGQGELNCNDGNICTVDSCASQSGCVHAPNQEPCDDLNICTVTDTCAGGACVGSGTLDCEDGNICTTDTCDPGQGCLYEPNDKPCNDGNACTTDDLCVAGECTPGAPLNCNDGDDCTDDTCDPAVGCLYPAIVPCCGNGQTDGDEDCDGADDAACPGQCNPDCTCPWITIHNTVNFAPTNTADGCSYNNAHAIKWLNLGNMDWKSCVIEASKRGAMLHSQNYTVAGGWYSHRKNNYAMTGKWSSYQQADIGSSQVCILARDPHANTNNSPLNSTVEYDGWLWRYQDYGNKYYDQCQTIASNAGAMIITPWTLGLGSGDGYWVNSVHMCNTYEWITNNGAGFTYDNYNAGQRSSSRKCMVGYPEKINL